MAFTRPEKQVEWAAADSKSIASGGGIESSDIITLDIGCVGASVTLKAKNDGVAVAGDIISVFVIGSSGDPDGSAADEYGSEDTKHGTLLCTLDTSISDPAITEKEFPNFPQNHKIFAINDSTGNSITFSATIEQFIQS